MRSHCPLTCGICTATAATSTSYQAHSSTKPAGCFDDSVGIIEVGRQIGQLNSGCWDVGAFCSHDVFGASVKQHCPLTCGVCQVTPAVTSVVTTTTRIQTQSPGCADDYAGMILAARQLGEQIKGCMDVNSFCFHELYGAVARQHCPVTCGVCQTTTSLAPGVTATSKGAIESSSCADDNGAMIFAAGQIGRQISDCRDIDFYCFHDDYGAIVRKHCPLTCGLCQTTTLIPTTDSTTLATTIPRTTTTSTKMQTTVAASPSTRTTTSAPSGAPALCTNDPPGYADVDGLTCLEYERREWCKGAGYGPAWRSHFGVFDDYKSDEISPGEACCACGGGGANQRSTTKEVSTSVTLTTTSVEPESCTDAPSDYADNAGATCAYYEQAGWCLNSDYGPAWRSSYGAFDVYARASDGLSPGDACCACGGGARGGKTTTTTSTSRAAHGCTNEPNSYTDVDGLSCLYYENQQWCENGGYGPAWLSTFGTFDDFARNGRSPGQACCACGGGSQH